MLEHILKSFLISTPDVDTPFDAIRPNLTRVALVVFSSNNSLCDSFNISVLKMMQQAIEDYRRLGTGKDNIIIYPVGRRVAERVVKVGHKTAGNFIGLTDKPNTQTCQGITHEAAQKFLNDEYDKVEMIYHHFKNVGSQILTRKTFLPIDLSTEIGRGSDRDLGSSYTVTRAQEYLRRKNLKVE